MIRIIPTTLSGWLACLGLTLIIGSIAQVIPQALSQDSPRPQIEQGR